MGEINSNQKIIENISKSILFADVPGFIVVALDINKEIVYMNKNGCYILNDNISPIGKNWFENFVYESEQKKLEAEFESSISGKITKPIQECFVICSNSERRIIRWFHDIIKDGEKIIGLIYFGEDVTSKRYIQLELRHRIAMEQLIAEISTTFLNISQTPDLIEEKILNTLANVGVFVNCDRCSVFLFDKKSSNLSYFYEWCAKSVESNSNKMQESNGKDFSWLSDYIEEHNIIFTSKMTDLPENITPLNRLLSKKPIKSLLLIPMIKKNFHFGFLSLISESNEIVWSSQDIKLLQTIADLLSNVFCQSRIQEDKRIALKRLRESQQRFMNLAEKFPLPFVISNKHGKLLYFNPKFIDLVGYTLEDIPSNDAWMQIVYPDPIYRAKVDEYWKKVKEGLIEPRGNNVLCKNGQIRKLLFREFEINDVELAAIVEEVKE